MVQLNLDGPLTRDWTAEIGKADFSLKSKSVTVSELPGLLDKPLTKMHINDITLTNAEPGMGGVLCHGDSPSPLTVNYLGK